MTRRSDSDNDGETSSPSPSWRPKKCKGEKHVSFPPDEEIVSGFAERKDTINVDSLTLAEVIEAYKRSCDKHQVEPKPKILEQLEQVTSLNGRAPCLDLKGERLDPLSCEALEVILKSLSFDFINLQAAELEENGASSLLDMILYYESTPHLDISDNTSMGISGWKALSHLIKQSVCLLRLDVCNVALLQYPAQVLSRALLSSRLTVLHLQSTCLSGRPLFTLVAALKSNRALRELYLSNNNLNSEQDSMQLGDLLRYNSSITTLDLSNNTIANSGLEEICEGLRGQTDGLKVLILWNNQITNNGLVHLAKVLPVLKTLETLNLGENNLQNRGIHTLRESLMMNHSLLQLGLEHTHITCEGAVALAEFLAESRQIQRLDVRENEVRAGGLMALSLALRINHSLTSLDLDHTPKQEQEDFLMETQKSLLREISELCTGNAARHRIATETELPWPDSSETR
ncbi:protein phosphatase 1 regulatory subunit 37 isoform X1 [Salvelinus fontinalis]|uniref:protein phosphatase 1 regulatory subunit 37 isoform X1 n=1 Tax=Salvelinus fontinalis TaxID=8038 RepID=UPI00248566DB|nr:protein phosphatase 1 regulatory subunit 37 isoform X1 [Salvelinus fontinalis]